MYKVTSRYDHHPNTIKVEWNLGKRCNYDCSYCPSEIHDNHSPHRLWKDLQQTVDTLLTLGKPIRLSFTGGEPTVHPDFEELVNYCKNRGISWISVTTNGTRKDEWYANLRVDQIVFSMHMEYDIRRILNTIVNVNEYFAGNVMVHVMAHQDHMKRVRYIAGALSASAVPHAVRRVRWTQGDHDLFDDMRYNVEDLAWVKEYEATVEPNTAIFYKEPDRVRQEVMHANDVIKLHRNQYKGWTCNAGIESLMINWDGDVHRATCRVGGSLGNIYEGNFVVPSEPVTCDRNFCTCAADIPLTKSLS
jgi:MoaA/NifB/PqqE/SkfB family radical SAM enzyme